MESDEDRRAEGPKASLRAERERVRERKTQRGNGPCTCFTNYDYDTHTEHDQAVIISLVQAVSPVNNLSPQLLLF